MECTKMDSFHFPFPLQKQKREPRKMGSPQKWFPQKLVLQKIGPPGSGSPSSGSPFSPEVGKQEVERTKMDSSLSPPPET